MALHARIKDTNAALIYFPCSFNLLPMLRLIEQPWPFMQEYKTCPRHPFVSSLSPSLSPFGAAFTP
jgi:hypothetical protein